MVPAEQAAGANCKAGLRTDSATSKAAGCGAGQAQAAVGATQRHISAGMARSLAALPPPALQAAAAAALATLLPTATVSQGTRLTSQLLPALMALQLPHGEGEGGPDSNRSAGSARSVASRAPAVAQGMCQAVCAALAPGGTIACLPQVSRQAAFDRCTTHLAQACAPILRHQRLPNALAAPAHTPVLAAATAAAGLLQPAVGMAAAASAAGLDLELMQVGQHVYRHGLSVRLPACLCCAALCKKAKPCCCTVCLRAAYCIGVIGTDMCASLQRM
jgi:hypothetical protein